MSENRCYRGAYGRSMNNKGFTIKLPTLVKTRDIGEEDIQITI
jgi:hypothetical protein